MRILIVGAEMIGSRYARSRDAFDAEIGVDQR